MRSLTETSSHPDKWNTFGAGKQKSIHILLYVLYCCVVSESQAHAWMCEMQCESSMQHLDSDKEIRQGRGASSVQMT